MAARLKQIAVCIVGLCVVACQSVSVPDAGTAYLVRHAEKVTSGEAMIIADPRNPPLTEAGAARAELLSGILAGEGVTAIWSTNYQRTLDTAAPLAERLGLKVQIYDPNDLMGFAELLRADPSQTVLIVGHSNTTPDMSAALGGEPGTPIYEASEHDRLYVVNLDTGETEIRRFGTRFDPATAQN